LLRSVSDVEAGFVYFQQLNITFDEYGNPTQAPEALTLHRIAVADVASVLADASDSTPLTTLAGADNVQLLGASTRPSSLTPDDILVIEGYLPASLFPQIQGAGALVASVVYNFPNDTETFVISRSDGSGNVTLSTPLPGGSIEDIFLDPLRGLFIRTESRGSTGELAYHVNPVTGVLSQISTSLFDGIAEGGGIPEGVAFLSGTDGNDPLGDELAASAQSQWIAGGSGNDTLSGGAGEDLLYGGPGGDTLRGAGDADVLSGMGGDDRLRGGLGADTIYGGPGTDRVQYYSPEELDGDVVTGSNTIWSGSPSSIAAGLDNSTTDRIQLFGTGIYDFDTADVSYIDRIDVVSGVQGAAQGDFELILTPEMAATANQNSNTANGDIRVVGYHDNGTQTPPATTANIKVDATAFGTQALVVTGQDGSGDPNAATAFGGMRGNDTLLGGGGGDYLFSGGGNDSIVSGGGNDTISGGAGDDTINGGDQIDLAVYVGALAEYTVTFANGVLTVADTVSGRDGTDQVSNVERFQFADVFYGHDGLGQLFIEPPPQ
jgi:Ca2+-binding RTX toxin-like protein